MSRYKPYPQYKDSGVEWLGEVPEHWEKGLLSNLFTNNKEKNSGMFNNNLLSLSYGKIVNKDIETSFGLLPESFESYQIVHDGYIVLRLTDLQNDQKSLRTGFVTQTGIITSAYVGLKKKSKFIGNEKYFYLYLHTFDVFKGFYGMGSGVRQSLNYDELKKLQFILPSLNEQNAIVNFLDNATCKIDTLIQKQQNLIELLKEKRQALISHTVTKGLNPHVKMKDSGVEWLGDIPEHWTSVCLKWIAKIYSGGTPDKTNLSYWEEGTIPWISSGEVNQFFITEPTTYITQEAYEKSSAKWIPKNALVMALAGQGKTKGMIAQLGIMTTCNQSMAAIVLSENVSERFIFWWLTSNYEKIRNLAGGDLRDGLNLDIIGSIVCPYFLLSEQQQIANYLDNATCKIDTLISKAQKAIELLKERRTALISAAVTGKIDVRSVNE